MVKRILLSVLLIILIMLAATPAFAAESEISAPDSIAAEYVGFQKIEVSWDAVDGADGYIILRRESAAELWTEIGETEDAAYVDKEAADGKTFYYTVCSYEIVDGQKLRGELNAEGTKLVSQIPAPKLVSAEYTDYRTAVLSWNASPGANRYYVYRRKSDEKSWTRLGFTTETNYTDNNSADGQTYYYTVKSAAVTSAGVVLGKYDAAGIKFYSKLPAPKLISAEYTDYQTIVFSWNASPGADGYNVYRKKSGDSSWTKLTTTTKTSYTDKKAADGNTYIYTAKPYAAVDSAKVWGRYDANGVKCYSKIAAPKLVSAEYTDAETVVLKWNAVAGADGYRVYRKIAGEASWTFLKQITGLKYTDTKATNGKTYVYTVTPYAMDGSKRVLGRYDKSGISIVSQLPAPIPVSAESCGFRSVKVTWKKSVGADGYYIYRRAKNETSWTRFGPVSGTVYYDNAAIENTVYQYRIKACATVSKRTIASNYQNTLSVTATFPAPKNISAENTALDKIRLKWDAVSGAKGYKVYRKSSAEDGWTYLGISKTNEYTDTVTCGSTYIYTVKGYAAADGKTIYGGYDKDGFTVKAIPAIPALKKLTPGVREITVAWDAESGVDGFYVYRKETDTAWKRIAATTETSYCDKTTEPDVTYYYTVRAYKLCDGVKVFGSYKDTVRGKCISHVHFHQGDDAWGFSSKLKKKACVLCCMSMMLKNLGENANPRLVYDANGEDSGMEFDKALAYYGRKNVCAISTSSKYYAGYDAQWGWTYVKNPEENAVKAIREALDRNPEGVMCYFVRGNDMHGIVAISYDKDNIYYSDPGRVYDKGYNVTFNNTWCKKGHNMSYKHLKLIQAID